MRIPDNVKFQIEWLINRQHVSRTADEIRAHIRDRMADQFPSALREPVLRYAVRQHEKNQRLYGRVMGRI